ncbi:MULTISPECIES: chemotaxis protein CheC [Virgibacillus]|uniref:CheY-P phosphatase CheC n=2 Tax=Virgibacillus TaxID=84406 RepID=A0A024QCX2_9BACI|nr:MULTISPECIES: chemotaxis protein CheC [Virgibacillus]EQB36394.1 hypothetical protein M948_15295 [Virgibacillus sp. CM-4]MYL42227.1 CheY-P-specific phosphatase CheC [Virgibacillus massiliensis]GGJ44255.1 CheY-P phosphatase CheC [Virgibacillus kapii]CDQ40092.1 CheY-P phosphatase CheC [Virgibacillus massiliensis]
MEISNLTMLQKDVLREIGNIGAGNAATSLSKLVNRRIDMQAPVIKMVNYEEIMGLIGGPEEIITAIVFRIEGEAPGTVYFILSVNEAENLIQEIIQKPEVKLSDSPSNTLAISVLEEVGNILTGAYISALSDLTQINMYPSVPYFSLDMAGAILTAGLVELSQITDCAIIIDTKMNPSTLQDEINGSFLFVPDPDAFHELFQSLGINEHE